MSSSPLTKNTRSADLWGAAASTLCLIHCLATPFLFVAQAEIAGHHGHGEHPLWWGLIDVALLIVSLAAVYWAAKNSSKAWMKVALGLTWALLAFIIINEKLELIHLAEAWIYVPAVSLVGLHFYNWKYCQCEDEACATPLEQEPV